MSPTAHLDVESCYRAVKSRDRRFDGVFYTAVASTGIYCRPSCPARTPALRNVSFHPTAASAQAAGFRACKRCLPDATPGSPDWDVAADTAGRAMRLIADGVVDREGVGGLAGRVGYTSRHLTRLLTHELGAGPLALARARRAQTARTLIETTDLGFSDVAFAAGFSSVRQFNDTVREVYAASPTQLRGRRSPGESSGSLDLRLVVRTPFAGRALHAFLAARTIPGVESADETSYARTLRLPHGPGVVRLALEDLDGPGTAFVPATFTLTDLRDIGAAVERVRRLLDADCDPVAVTDAFRGDPVLGRVVRRAPGLRVPGHVDGGEIAVRAVLGQQISVARARRLAETFVERDGEVLPEPIDGLTRLFPTCTALADRLGEHDGGWGMPRARSRALEALCSAIARGAVPLDRSADRVDVRAAMLALPGIGPWTADYIAMRALGDPDVFLPTDTGTRDALRRAGVDPGRATSHAEAWRPWRSYAQTHLWHSLSATITDEDEETD